MAKTVKSGIREGLFTSHNFKSKPVTIFGQVMDVHQPSLGQLTGFNSEENKDKNAIALLMIDYCFVPDTNTKVFEPSDYGAITAMPSGDWIKDFQAIWMELAGIDPDAATKNSEETA